MKINKYIHILVVYTIVFFTGSQVQAQEQEIRNLFREHINAFNKEDLPGTVSAYHSKSPVFGPYVQGIQFTFRDYDLEASLDNLVYLGENDGFAIIQVKVTTERNGGNAYKDNTTIQLYVFKKENTRWKVWSNMTIEAKPTR